MSTLEQIYAAQLKAQKEQLAQDHAAAEENLNYQKDQTQQATDANLNRTAVESQKSVVNQAELHNASGLSSGARAQVRLAQENQLQADMTALRAAQQESDAMIERQRGILAQEYASAIRQAQAENDLAKATALYEEAQRQEEIQRQQELGAAQLMAQAGDYSRISKYHKLSPEETAALQAAAAQGNQGTGLTYDQAYALYENTGDVTFLKGVIPDAQYWSIPRPLENASQRVRDICDFAKSTYDTAVANGEEANAAYFAANGVENYIANHGLTLTEQEYDTIHYYITYTLGY
jgi:hypothetical protein